MNPFFPDRRIAIAVYSTCLLFFVIFGATEIRIRSHVDTPQHHGHDFGTYWTAGAAIHDGRDPYTITDYGAPPYIYPPFFASVFLPFSKLPSQVAGIAWYTLNVVLLALTHLEFIRLVNVGRALSPPGRHWVTWPALIGLAPSAITTMQGGQVTIALLFFLVLGFRLLVTGWPRLGGVMMMVAAAIKVSPALVPVIVLLWLLISRSERAIPFATGLLIGGFLWFFAVPGLLLGWSRNIHLLAAWIDHMVLHQDRVPIAGGGNQSLFWVLPAPAAIAVALTILVLLAMVILRGAASDDFIFGLACVAAAIFSPVAWHHHFYITAPALVFTRSKAAVLSAAALLVTHATLRYWFLDTRLLGIGMAVWLIAVCAAATFGTAPRPSADPIPAP